MWSLLVLPKPCVCRGRWHCMGLAAWSTRGLMSEPRTPSPPMQVLSRNFERSSCLVRSRRNNSNKHWLLELRFKTHLVQVKGCRNEPPWCWATGETASRSLLYLLKNECVNVCVCAYKYCSHVRFCWTTGISNLITPPAPDLRSLGRRAGGAANCYLRHLKQHTITLLFQFCQSTLSGDTQCKLELHSVAWDEPVGTIWSNLLLPRIIMQVLPFFDFLWAFYTELQVCLYRADEDSCAFKCEKDAGCAHSI